MRAVVIRRVRAERAAGIGGVSEFTVPEAELRLLGERGAASTAA